MAMMRKYWLIDDVRPANARSNVFDVKEGSVQITAAGLGPADVLDIEVRVDGGTTANPADFVWEKLHRNGRAIQLSRTHNQLVINIPGVYRVFRPTTVAGPVRVAVWENDKQFELIEFSNQTFVGESSTATVTVPCASPPMPVGDSVIAIERCDAATKAKVTLLVKVDQPNNANCPPTAGMANVVGYITADGTMGTGAYPGTLTDCAVTCVAATPQGLVATWG